MDSEELSEWMAYEQYIEPLPDLYWAAGMIASTIANFTPNKRAGKWKPKDFMPVYRERIERTPEQEVAYLDALFGA